MLKKSLLLLIAITTLIALAAVPGGAAPTTLSEAFTSQVTVTSTVRFVPEDEAQSGQGVWLAGLSKEEDAPPTALALGFSQLSAGWFGKLWSLHLSSDEHLLPEALAPQEGTGFLAGSDYLTLVSMAPVWGHEYQASLGYNPQTGAASVYIYDTTDNSEVLAKNLQLTPATFPLYAAAGVSSNNQNPIATIKNLATRAVHLPAGISWWLMQKSFLSESYMAVEQIDRRQGAVISTKLPWDRLDGELRYELINGDGAQVAGDLLTLNAENPVSFGSLTPGSYRLDLKYTTANQAFQLDSKDITLGRLATKVSDLQMSSSGSDALAVKGNLVVTADGPLHDLVLGVAADLTLSAFSLDSQTHEGRLEAQPAAGDVVLATVALDSMTEETLEIPFSATIAVPDASAKRGVWQIEATPFAAPSQFLQTATSSKTWLAASNQGNTWDGYLSNQTSTHLQLAPGIDVYRLQGEFPAGPLVMHLLKADLTVPGVRLETLVGKDLAVKEALWPRSRVGNMVADTGAVAGVNSSFFQISDTMNPNGMLMRSGNLLKSGLPGYLATVGITDDGIPYFGGWQWQGGMQKADAADTYHLIGGVNMADQGYNELNLFRSPWIVSPGTEGVNGSATELVIAASKETSDGKTPDGLPARIIEGTVEEVRVEQPGVRLRPDVFVVSGYGEPGRYLADTYQPGDKVEIFTALTGFTAWPGLKDWRQLENAISGNIFLVQNGNFAPHVFSNTARHPRTAVATTWDQETLYLLVVDGRSDASVGMTYKELADFFLYMGAAQAINLDGGGSSTLAIRDPRSGAVYPFNTPSDGTQRYVSDGLGVFYTP